MEEKPWFKSYWFIGGCIGAILWNVFYLSFYLQIPIIGYLVGSIVFFSILITGFFLYSGLNSLPSLWVDLIILTIIYLNRFNF